MVESLQATRDSDYDSKICPLCTPDRPLDPAQHMGAHILHNQTISRDSEPCGLCLCPTPLCQFTLTKGKGRNGKRGEGKVNL